MIAPAGCGKTHLIAEAVASCCAGRELILTHTHAGVDALRRHLREMGAPPKSYVLDTIASWALRYAGSFPAASGLATPRPRSSVDYAGVYAAGARLLECSPIREIIRSSYSGVFVDEYQDCNLAQHELVLRLRDLIPCRVLGDPLQGIFNFSSEPTINWERSVRPAFVEIPGPTTPWRWKGHNEELGEWLAGVRESLETGEAIDLRAAPIKWYDGNDDDLRRAVQIQACRDAARNGRDSVVGIHSFAPQCHEVARRLGGQFSCAEAVDLKDLYDFAEELDSASSFARSASIVRFAGRCMTGVKGKLSSLRKALEEGRTPKTRKYPRIRDSVVAFAEDGSLESIPKILELIQSNLNAKVFRRELLREARRSTQLVIDGTTTDLREAVWLVRNRARRTGRLLSRCTVGTTLLVKGLEFDHAVVLDADGLDVRNLYVALTRGTKSLSVVSRSRELRPRPGRGGLGDGPS